MKNSDLNNANKDLLLTTTELLASSETFHKMQPNQHINNYNSHIQTSYNNNNFSFKKFPDDISYYKNLVFEMNNEIGNINNKLSQIDTSFSMSKQSIPNNQLNINSSPIDNSNQNINNKHYPNYDNKDLLSNQISLNYTMNTTEEDKKINQLEKDRQELIMKNQELEKQLAQLEQFAKGTDNSNNTFITDKPTKRTNDNDIDDCVHKMSFTNLYTNSNPNYSVLYGDNSSNSRNTNQKNKNVLIDNMKNKTQIIQQQKRNVNKNLSMMYKNKRSNSYVDNCRNTSNGKVKKQKRAISLRSYKERLNLPERNASKQKVNRNYSFHKKRINSEVLNGKIGKEEYQSLLMKLRQMIDPSDYEVLSIINEIEVSVGNYVKSVESKEKAIIDKYKKEVNLLEKENKELKNKVKKIMEITQK
jgi:hypothetical protein